MKKIDLINEAKVNIPSSAINYIDTEDLKKYLSTTEKFLSEEGKSVVKYLIAHPNYVKELGSDGATNALASFVERHSPKNDEEKELLKNCVAIIKNDRQFEIPTFLTKTQFEGIINGEILPDEVILDLKSEKGRSKILKKFEPMIHKIINKYVGKSSLTYEDLYSASMEWLVKAMNNYGKDNSSSTKSTFMNFAFTYVRNGLIDEIRNNGRMVRTAVSVQKAEKKAKGVNSRENIVSGDKKIDDKENGKTVFDMIKSFDVDGDNGANKQDMEDILRRVFKAIDAHFPTTTKNGKKDNTLDIFYSYYGVNGYEKMSNKELAKKYGIEPSNVSYYCKKVNDFLRSKPQLMKELRELFTMQMEAKYASDDFQRTYVLENDNDYSNDYDNVQWKVDKYFESNGKNCICDILLKTILEMDNETECRKSINTILTNEDALSKKYSVAIKSFVNFVNDIVEESENVEYADSIIRISKYIGKDKIMSMFSVKESEVEPKDAVRQLLSSTNNDDKALAVLIKYYMNHFDSLEIDKEELATTDIKKQIVNGYEKVYGKRPQTPFDGLKELCQLVIDNNIQF